VLLQQASASARAGHLTASQATGLYYPQLDVLRFLLATAVVAEHAGFALWEQTGTLAVQVFFALSGWLIGGILLRSNVSDLPRFFYNRVTRIWIPYIVAVGLLVALSLWREGEHIGVRWLEFVFYKLTFVYNLFGHSQFAHAAAEMPLRGTGHMVWSIAAEEQFYLVAPLLILLLPRGWGRYPLFWLAVYVVTMWTSWLFFAAISLGVLAACAQQRWGDWHEHSTVRFVLVALAALMLAAMVQGRLSYPIGQPLVAVATVLALAQAGSQHGFCKFMGGISYPLYLTHWLGLFAANAVWARWGTSAPTIKEYAAVALAWVAASLFYLAIDRNIQRLRPALFTPRRGRVATASAYAVTGIGLVGGLLIMLAHR
jgi:peptidoglycan/LPS O-acetylase OafA/YrhL